LQELRYAAPETFEGVMGMGAMENVFPEDWPLVLVNFRRVLKPGGPLYLTVELLSEEEILTAYEAGRALGAPLGLGEHLLNGGYHYYPALAQVRAWLAEAGFAIVQEETGDGYQHYLCR
jgi:cyclopropane fatty-acyl-phospholipid synthase-like methyltransferase